MHSRPRVVGGGGQNETTEQAKKKRDISAGITFAPGLITSIPSISTSGNASGGNASGNSRNKSPHYSKTPFSLLLLIGLLSAVGTLSFFFAGRVVAAERARRPSPTTSTGKLLSTDTSDATTDDRRFVAALRGNVNPPEEEESSKNENKDKKRIAICITVTKDLSGAYLDGAAVLKHSMELTHSRHDIEFVAIVHPEVQSTRPGLREIGFRVKEVDIPLRSSEIQGKHLRETIDKSGCCGIVELLKLRGYQLLEYDQVLLMDMDAIILKNIDHLFELLDVGNRSALFTYDHAMSSRGSLAPPVQGGFILVRPSQRVYDEIVNIVRIGDFRPSLGWGGLKIGWCWGGQTIQGVVSYYYNAIAEKHQGISIDPCLYNSMASTPNCTQINPKDAISAHFTVCQKPWDCHRGNNEVCQYFHAQWWDVRSHLEKSLGKPVTGRCCRDRAICPNRKYINLYDSNAHHHIWGFH